MDGIKTDNMAMTMRLNPCPTLRTSNHIFMHVIMTFFILPQKCSCRMMLT